MNFVITLLGRDRLGIVESFSKMVTEHGGAWCESRVLQVEGQFGGVFLADVKPENADLFESALRKTFEAEFTLGIVRSAAGAQPQAVHNTFRVRVICSDRRGLLHQFAQLCTAREINIVELQTNLGPAPMTGLMMFEINAVGDTPVALGRAEFRDALEALGNDVVVDFSDADPPEVLYARVDGP